MARCRHTQVAGFRHTQGAGYRHTQVAESRHTQVAVYRQGNEVAAALAGYWFDQTQPPLKCAAITNLTAWKIFEYSFYAETAGVEELQVVSRDRDDLAPLLPVVQGVGFAFERIRHQ